MHQILIKADLFDRVIDKDMRNRFRLKDGIKIEKYLNLNHLSSFMGRSQNRHTAMPN
jgi:hypothetical protein